MKLVLLSLIAAPLLFFLSLSRKWVKTYSSLRKVLKLEISRPRKWRGPFFSKQLFLFSCLRLPGLFTSFKDYKFRNHDEGGWLDGLFFFFLRFSFFVPNHGMVGCTEGEEEQHTEYLTTPHTRRDNELNWLLYDYLSALSEWLFHSKIYEQLVEYMHIYIYVIGLPTGGFISNRNRTKDVSISINPYLPSTRGSRLHQSFSPFIPNPSMTALEVSSRDDTYLWAPGGPTRGHLCHHRNISPPRRNLLWHYSMPVK